jgi:hypothetical protein
MRPSDPEPKIPNSRDELVETLLLALRDVGVWEGMLPEDARAVAHVQQVQELANETLRRGIVLSKRLEQLSGENRMEYVGIARAVSRLSERHSASAGT